MTLRDAYGNTYTYAELGSVATLYPVLEPHQHTAVSSRIASSNGSSEPAPSGPASAGAQPRSPLSEGATVSSLALGAAAGLEAPPASSTPPPASAAPAAASPAPAATPREFSAGSDEVYLHPLSVGVQVLEGTVLGHVGPGTSSEQGSAGAATGIAAGGEGEPHMLFQIRPAGVGAPLIDPKPILDGWVQLENTSIFRAKGENPFLGSSPTVGQVLLESKEQLEQQVISDPGIHLPACGRQDVQTGQVDRRVLATLEFLSVSGLHPTVSSLRCSRVAAAEATNAAETAAGDAVAITAINGMLDRRSSGVRLDHRHHGPQAADAAGHDEAERDRQRGELSGHRQHGCGAFSQRQHPRRVRAARRSGSRGRRAGGAGSGHLQLGHNTGTVGPADRAVGRDPRPEGWQWALVGGDPRPRSAVNRLNSHNRLLDKLVLHNRSSHNPGLLDRLYPRGLRRGRGEG